jgi:hypothetical protein
MKQKEPTTPLFRKTLPIINQWYSNQGASTEKKYRVDRAIKHATDHHEHDSNVAYSTVAPATPLSNHDMVDALSIILYSIFFRR